MRVHIQRKFQLSNSQHFHVIFSTNIHHIDSGFKHKYHMHLLHTNIIWSPHMPISCSFMTHTRVHSWHTRVHSWHTHVFIHDTHIAFTYIVATASHHEGAQGVLIANRQLVEFLKNQIVSHFCYIKWLYRWLLKGQLVTKWYYLKWLYR